MTLETRTTDASAKSVQGFARAGSIRALGSLRGPAPRLQAAPHPTPKVTARACDPSSHPPGRGWGLWGL